MSAETADLDRLLDGNKPAWDRFVGRYAPVIYAAVHRRLGPAGRSGDAEDVAQDVFVRLCARDFRLLRSYDANRARITTWLTVIASSAAIDHLRRQRGYTQTLETVPEAALAVDPVEPVVPLQIPDGLLSPRQTLILDMLYTQDMDVADAAATLGVDPQTVRSTHHKALTKLRAHFRESGDG
jgi:RNA polymerase sigma-70 factor (ECF subfamily)